jgi:hypothetical protein
MLAAPPFGGVKSEKKAPKRSVPLSNFRDTILVAAQPTNIHVVHDCYCAAKLSLNYSEKSSSPLEHPALRNVKLINFFFYFWVILALLDPDPANKNQCGSTTVTTLTDGKVDGQALEDVLREMVDGEGVQDPGRDAEEEQQVTRILLLLASLPHTGRQRFQAVLRIQDVYSGS